MCPHQSLWSLFSDWLCIQGPARCHHFYQPPATQVNNSKKCSISAIFVAPNLLIQSGAATPVLPNSTVFFLNGLFVETFALYASFAWSSCLNTQYILVVVYAAKHKEESR